MVKDKDPGIFCLKDRKFYYYEPGPAGSINSIERIRGTLLSRGLIDYTVAPGEPGGYLVMTIAEAKLEDYEIVAIYPNDHVRRLKEVEKENTRVAESWD